MIIAKQRKPNPADFLEVWVDDNIDHQPVDVKKAHQLAKRFTADAAAKGLVLADFDFDDATLLRHVVQAMAAPRV